MFPKVLGLRRILASVVNRYPHGKMLNYIYQPTTCGGQALISSARYSHRCDAHMNELPVPCEPWEPWYRAKQRFYNKVLVGGIAWFLFSLGMMIFTDSIYLNFSPPLYPGPPSDMVDECED